MNVSDLTRKPTGFSSLVKGRRTSATGKGLTGLRAKDDDRPNLDLDPTAINWYLIRNTKRRAELPPVDLYSFSDGFSDGFDIQGSARTSL